MTVVSNGLWAYDLDDPVGPPTQTFVTRRIPVANQRPIVHIFDRQGNAAGRLLGEAGPVAWRADGYGTMTMRLSPAEAERKAALLAHGAPVKLEFVNGLPPWSGVLDLPESATRDATQLTIYSTEYQLGWVVAGEDANFISISDGGERDWYPASIVYALMQQTDLGSRFHMEPAGHRYSTTKPLTIDGRGIDLLSIFNSIRSAAPEFHWLIEPIGFPVSSTMRTLLHPYEVYRRDRRDDVQLIEGANFVQVEAVAQGPIYNYITVAAGNYDPDDPVRREYLVHYGDWQAPQLRRERFITATEVTGSSSQNDEGGWQELLRQRAIAEHARWSRPRTRVRGVVLNRRPALFGSFGPGDVVSAMLNRRATSVSRLTVILTSMEFDPTQGLLTVVGEEITDEEVLR